MQRRYFIEKLLMSPQIVLIVCSILVIFHLIIDGTAVKIWKLSQKEAYLTHKISHLKEKSHNISLKIQRNYMPTYLEKMAREQFDMVKDQDLIFLFSHHQ